MEKKLTKEEKETMNYEKFKKTVKRVTEFAHNKRMFSRMEYQKKKTEEERKVKKNNKKDAAVKKETVA